MTPSSLMLDKIPANLVSGDLGAGNISFQMSDADFNEVTGVGFNLATFHGYSVQYVTASWVAGVDAVSDEREVVLPAPAGGFKATSNGTFSGTTNIYGYRLVDVATGDVLGHRRFSTPRTITSAGETIHIDEVVRFLVSAIALH